MTDRSHDPRELPERQAGGRTSNEPAIDIRDRISIARDSGEARLVSTVTSYTTPSWTMAAWDSAIPGTRSGPAGDRGRR